MIRTTEDLTVYLYHYHYSLPFWVHISACPWLSFNYRFKQTTGDKMTLDKINFSSTFWWAIRRLLLFPSFMKIPKLVRKMFKCKLWHLWMITIKIFIFLVTEATTEALTRCINRLIVATSRSSSFSYFLCSLQKGLTQQGHYLSNQRYFASFWMRPTNYLGMEWITLTSFTLLAMCDFHCTCGSVKSSDWLASTVR